MNVIDVQRLSAWDGTWNVGTMKRGGGIEKSFPMYNIKMAMAMANHPQVMFLVHVVKKLLVGGGAWTVGSRKPFTTRGGGACHNVTQSLQKNSQCIAAAYNPVGLRWG
jgi:hypothetical protein